MLTDIVARDPNQLQYHDICVAGIPWQPFANIGLRDGGADRHGWGGNIEQIVAALVVKKPRAFILEKCAGPYHSAQR